VLDRFGGNLSDSDLDQIMGMGDKKGSGTIDKKEFVDLFI
jgi:Ca2+-binding EF-hand superfamily protein